MSTATFTCWFSVSATVTAAPNFHFFGKGAGSALCMQLYGTNILNISMVSGGGPTAGQLITTIAPNVNYFIVCTYSSGSQAIYLGNDVPSATASVAGNTANSVGDLLIGCDNGQTGAVSVTVSQPAIFNYVLLKADIDALLLGTATPLSTSFSGGAAIWAPTLDGTLGATPTAADPGVTNTSSAIGALTGSNYTLSTITHTGSATAQYVADLAYAPPMSLPFYIDRTGTLLVAVATNTTNTSLINITSVPGSPSVWVNGSPVTVYGPVWTDISKDSPFVVWQLKTPILATDIVTYTLPFGAVTVANGVSDVVVSQTAVPNYVGQWEPGFGGVTNLQPKYQMPLGVNIGYAVMDRSLSYTVPKNARLRMYAMQGTGITSDPNGQPLTWPAGTTIYGSVWSTSAGGNRIETNPQLSGTVSVTNGSAAIVFSATQTLLNNTYIKIGGAMPYLIPTGGTGTHFTFATNYAGSTNGSATATVYGQTGIPAPQGVYSIVFDDVNALGAGKAEVWLSCDTTIAYGMDGSSYSTASTGPTLNGTVTLSASTTIIFLIPQTLVAGQNLLFSTGTTPYTLLTGGTGTSFTLTATYTGTTSTTATAAISYPTTYNRSVAGNGTTVTVSYTMTYVSLPNPAYGYNPNINFFINSAGTSGLSYWGTNPGNTGPTISNLCIFTPGDEDNTRSDPYAISNTLKGWLTATNGNGPACLRFMDSVGGFGGNIVCCYQNYADCQSGSQYFWGVRDQTAFTFTYARHYNTNPSSGTYAWSSPKIYHNLLGFDGIDSVGFPVPMNYLDLTKGNTITPTEQGASFTTPTPGTAAIEFVTLAAHGLRSGDLVELPLSTVGTVGSAANNWPYLIPCTGNSAYAGTAHVINGQTNITFSQSQSIAVNTCFTLDNTGTVYYVVSGGGTSFTLNTAFTGVTNTTATVTTGITLSGTATVSNGSATITFGQTQAILSNLCFTLDSTGIAYRIRTGGIGTVFTMDPIYQGSLTTVSATVTAAYSLIALSASAWVTGANTFVLMCGNAFNSISGISAAVQTVNTTVQIPMVGIINTPTIVQGAPIPKGTVAPYGFAARMTAYWPGCKCWIPIGPYMTDACIQSIANEIAPYLLPGTIVIPEHGLEQWNLGFATAQLTGTYGALMQYVNSGQVVNPYYTSAGTALNHNQAYTIMTAHQQDVMQTQLNTFGKGLQVERVFGCQTGNAGTIVPILSFGAASNIGGATGLQQAVPMGSITIASYVGAPAVGANGQSTTYIAACNTTGGNWPVAAIHSFFRHLLKYWNTLWGFYSPISEQLSTYGGPTGQVGQVSGIPSLIGYEVQIQAIDPQDAAPLQHDLFYAPEMADTFAASLQSYADGNPTVAGSGLLLGNLYSMGGWWGGVSQQQLWSVIIYQGQGGGSGLANQFTTEQGGSPADGFCHDVENVSLELPIMQNWFAAETLVTYDAQANLISSSIVVAKEIAAHNAQIKIVAQSAVNATGSRTYHGASTLTSASTIITKGSRTYHGLSTLTSASTIITKGSRTYHGLSTLTSASTIITTGNRIYHEKSSLVCSAAITSTGSRIYHGAYALISVSTIIAAAMGDLIYHGASTLTSVSAIIATGSQTYSGNSSLVCTSVITPKGSRTYHAKSALTSVSVITPKSSQTYHGKSSLACSSVITSKGSRTYHIKSALTSVSTIIATGSVGTVLTSVSTIIATGNLSILAENIPPPTLPPRWFAGLRRRR